MHLNRARVIETQTNLEASLDPSELRVTETTPRLWSRSSCFTLSPPSLSKGYFQQMEDDNIG